MEDIFISYASEDREQARRFAEAFAARGWSVWWDRHIVPGEAFDTRIEQALDAAQCVVVLWSASSVASEWVRNEAAVGAERGVLVPAMIEPVKLPLEFRRKQTADLCAWRGDPAHPGFVSLCNGIARALGEAGRLPPPATSGGVPRPERDRPGPARFTLLAGTLAALGLLAWWSWGQRAVDPVDVPPAAPARLERPAGGGPDVSLAARVAGTYFGDVIADSKGSSRSDVSVTLTATDGRSVRVSSDYPRIPVVDVPLTRAGEQVISAAGDTALMVDLSRHPPQLTYSPRGELSFSGVRQ
ncbi:toll/interleukin-1 receptor domain-containing protein [Zoogloea sp.]|uniref:toll/interleukin-1 receptor domain-containing protein n=1 Tax=Zoogloea sp. TaxID=49181 RepID=UPI001ACF5FC7|nr:toll/interleukin-1 receptor domain-containing protein [Zoogloea sp.]MBN8282987.1 toll/interleukin-1 receptor domain-containing protein [Zoogloea sp.]